MLISSSKDLPNHRVISERDLILANALAYVEALEEKIAARKRTVPVQRAAELDRIENSNRETKA